MANYTQTTFFAPKDALLSGNPAKLIKGAEVDPELAAIAAAITSKYDSANFLFANPGGTVGLTVVNGTASTPMRSDAAPPLSQAIVPTWTGVHTFTAVPVFSNGLNVGGITFTGLANPSASAGLTAVNGSAVTAMRSDGAPAVSQSIAPTWTGAHVFSPSGTAIAVSINGAANQSALQVTGVAASGQSFGTTISAGTTSADWGLLVQGKSGRNFLLLKGDASVSLGNSTDNPTYTFLGTGTTTLGGPATFGSTVTTGASLVHTTTTGAQAYFGAESSVGGTTFTGSSAYSAVIGSNNATALGLVTNATVRLAISSTGTVQAVDDAGTMQTVGWRDLPQNAQATNYTAVMADRGKHLYNSNAAGIAFTIPANASVAYPLGTTLTFVNAGGAASCTIAITSDTLIFAATAGTGTRTLAGSGVATAIKVTSTSWHISGVGLT